MMCANTRCMGACYSMSCPGPKAVEHGTADQYSLPQSQSQNVHLPVRDVVTKNVCVNEQYSIGHKGRESDC